MVTKQKHFLDSLRQMVSKPGEDVCPNCQTVHEGDICPENAGTNGAAPEDTGAQIKEIAFLVDLVSNHKIKIPTPVCKVGRDESNDIVVSGDQSISRHHLTLSYEENQHYIEDLNSRHGTFLNGTQIKERQAINDGDVIKVGVSFFWFVLENDMNLSDSNDTSETTANTNGQSKGNEPAHLIVKSDILTEPSDPSTSTMNDIPVMPNEQTLLERLRLKTRSFDQQGLFTSAQTQMPAVNIESGEISHSIDNIQPAYQPSIESPASTPTNNFENKSVSIPQKSPSVSVAQPVFVSAETGCDSSVYDELMRNDLADLIDQDNQLKAQIDKAQKQRQEITRQLDSIRSVGLSLIGGRESNLIEACKQVLSQLGWQTELNPADPQELELNIKGQQAIARVIWTVDEPERSHLGQLSMAQTRLWCDKGQEPKGILIISRLSKENHSLPLLTDTDYESELSTYAAKKGVCMMTSLQVLAIYRDLILKNANIETIREKIMNSNGWFAGFTIKSPG